MSQIINQIKTELRGLENTVYKLKNDKANQAIYNKVLSKINVAKQRVSKAEGIEKEIAKVILKDVAKAAKLQKQMELEITRATVAITEATILIGTIK
ncbi:MAG: hypothetical protein PVJ67_05205 [Candidatus Pacearchaeota archaeon]|jgi:hypothetical protein